MLSLWKENYDKSRQWIKKQTHHFVDQSPYSQSYGFSSSHVWMWDLDHRGLVSKNWWIQIVVLEKTLENPARISNQSILKDIIPLYSLEGLMLKLKLQFLATWWEESTHWKSLFSWERVWARGEGAYRGWDSWIASLTQWTCAWAISGRWWRTGKPGVLQSVGSQRVL